VLTLTGVDKRYGDRTALAGVSLSVGAGEILGLLGPNGAGKSTLSSIVAGLRPPDRGQVRVHGIDVVANPSLAQAHVGYAPQEIGVHEVLTVRENLTFFAELVGLKRKARVGRVDEVATRLGLTALLDRTAFELSGGERRRLHTAIAFLHRPALLLLDEPTVGADVETRSSLLDLVRDAAAGGAAVVYSSHYLSEIEALDASVAILLRGRLIASGRLEDLVTEHGQTGVALSFDGPVPRCGLDGLAATVDGDVLNVETPDPAGTVAAVMHRLGAAASQVRSIDVLRPSLESVFVTLTGQRYSADEADVVAA
jgi:ABC-2 type transport system ATP-binding protein